MSLWLFLGSQGGLAWGVRGVWGKIEGGDEPLAWEWGGYVSLGREGGVGDFLGWAQKATKCLKKGSDGAKRGIG